MLIDTGKSWSGDLPRPPPRSGHRVRRLAEPFDGLPRDRTIAALCHGGRRSGEAAQLMQQAGIGTVANLTGGLIACRADGLPIEE